MKVCFLDLDGVANHNGGPTEPFTWPSGRTTNILKIDPVHIPFINEIIQKSECEVVISSSWRLHHSKEELQEKLDKEGFCKKFIDYTEDISDSEGWGNRGAEIQEWLDRHPEVETFVIIDDVDTMGQLNKFMVETDCRVGLTQEHVQQALDILEDFHGLHRDRKSQINARDSKADGENR